MKVALHLTNVNKKRKQESDIDSRPAKKQETGKENLIPFVHALPALAVPALAPRSVGRPKLLNLTRADYRLIKEKGTVGRPRKSEESIFPKGSDFLSFRVFPQNFKKSESSLFHR